MDIEEKISEVDIVSCATLSKTPLVLGKFVKTSQHINRVRTYKKEMREADNALITKASVFIDTPAGLHESGDISIPLNSGILTEKDIKGNLFSLSAKEVTGLKSDEEITLFKSVGHALEDLTTTITNLRMPNTYQNILKRTDFKPPEDWLQIKTIDMHTGGEPLRVIVSGFPEFMGNSVLEYRRYCKENFDHLRTPLMFEPRGHVDMYGCILTPPNDAEGDFGIIFLHNEGYSTLCGNAIIAIATLAVEMK
ncbi:MAG: hypothetical protein ACJA1P_000009 [Maribacter sp.]